MSALVFKPHVPLKVSSQAADLSHGTIVAIVVIIVGGRGTSPKYDFSPFHAIL